MRDRATCSITLPVKWPASSPAQETLQAVSPVQTAYSYVSDCELVTFICNIGTNLQNKFRSCNDSDFKIYLSHPVSESMYREPISTNEILDIIAKLNNNKSPGPDTPKLLKSIADEIINPLLYLFNLLFSTGTVPSALKLAKVIPVHKKEDKYCLLYTSDAADE